MKAGSFSEILVPMYQSTWRRPIGLLQAGPRLATEWSFLYLDFCKIKFLELFPHIK